MLLKWKVDLGDKPGTLDRRTPPRLEQGRQNLAVAARRQGGAQSRFAWSEAVFEPRGRSDAMG